MKKLFKKVELDIPEACVDRVHRIGNKTPDKIRPNNRSFHDIALPHDGQS